MSVFLRITPIGLNQRGKILCKPTYIIWIKYIYHTNKSLPTTTARITPGIRQKNPGMKSCTPRTSARTTANIIVAGGEEEALGWTTDTCGS